MFYMKKSYFMGIDNGGAMCKAVIFDSRGREISSASLALWPWISQTSRISVS